MRKHCGFFPTLAQLAGYNKRLPDNIDGGSMLLVLHSQGQGSIQRSNPFLIFHHAVKRSPQTALRLGNLKLVKTWRDKKLELFDLSKDLSESDDLSTTMPDQTEEFDTLMTHFSRRRRCRNRQNHQETPEQRYHATSTTRKIAIHPSGFSSANSCCILIRAAASSVSLRSFSKSNSPSNERLQNSP